MKRNRNSRLLLNWDGTLDSNFDGAFNEDIERYARIFEIVKVPPTKEWVTTNIWFDPKVSAQAGFWNRNTHPYSDGPLDAFDDQETKKITCMWATQTGKTSLLGAMISKAARFAMFASLIACPDENSAVEHQDFKLIPFLQNVQGLSEHIKPKAKRSKRSVDLGAALIYYAWSGAKWTVSGRPAQFVAVTETNLHSRKKSGEGDSVAMAADRTKGFEEQHKVYMEGKPSVKGECRLEAEYLQSDQCKYHVPCPHCGFHQELELGTMESKFGLKWESGPNGDVIPDSVYYCCRHKQCRIVPAEKPDMIRRGVWCPKGQAVNAAGELEGAPDRGKAHRGFQLDSLYANAVQWYEYAREFVAAKRKSLEALKNFIQSWCGRTFEEHRGVTLIEKDIYDHCGDNEAGVVPEDPLAIHLIADAQESRIHFMIRAWGYLAESWVVRYGECESLLALDAIVNESIWSPDKSKQYKVSGVWIDSGDGNRTEEIYQFCAPRYPHFMPLKGIAQYKQLAIVKTSKVPTFADIGMELVTIDNGIALDELHRRLKIKRGDPGYLWFHKGIGADYVRGVLAWKKKPREKPDRFGRLMQEWVSTSSTYEHQGDCLKYSEALGSALRFAFMSRPKVTPEEQAKIDAAKQRQMQERSQYAAKVRRDGRGWWESGR